MKKILIIPFILAFATIKLSAQDEITTLTYYDSFSCNTGKHRIEPLLSKEDRVKSYAGTIVVNGINDLPIGVQTSIAVAIDLWESTLMTKNVIIDFEYLPLGDEYDTQVDVIYINRNDILYPQSLIRSNEETFTDENTDAIITINSDSNWNYSHNDESSDGKNLTTALIRAIAHVFGFGSSLTEFRNYPAFVHNYYSIFDNFIFDNNNQYLSSIVLKPKRKNPLLEDYIQPDVTRTVHMTGMQNNYNLYAPETYDAGKTFRLLNEPTSVMHFEILENEKIHQIDDITLDILQKLGWNIKPQTNLTISCEQVGDNGCTSAYVNHTFQINGYENGDIDNVSWTLELPLKNGESEIYASSTKCKQFVTPAINNIDKYDININGDIYGQIKFTGTISGEDVQASYRVSLELKPTFLDIEIVDKNKVTEDLYDVTLSIRYTGCNTLKVEVEEDYSMNIVTSFINEPFFVIHKIKNLNYNYYSWIDLSISNKYGKATETIELSPENMVTFSDVKSNINDIPDKNINIYTSTGRCIGLNVTKTELYKLSSGTYIIHYMNEHNNICKTKVVLK